MNCAKHITGLVSIGSDSKATTLSDYDNLKTQLGKVTPTGTDFSAYNPTNSPQACPTQDSQWEAASNLPPSPNTAVCSCMVSNLTCVAKSSLSSDSIQDQFNYICDPAQGHYCGGILANASTGVYGAFSMCNETQRLSYAFNEYYLNQTATNTKNTSPCDFSGAASKVSPSLASSCKAVISQAGAAGTGSITNAPSATGGSSGGGSSGSSSSSKGAAGVVGVPELDLGILKLAAYVISAFFVGAGIVMM